MTTPPEEKLSSRSVFEGRVVSARVDEVRLSGGGSAVREVVDHRPAVVIVPLDECVPVFQEPFTLLIEVVPEATAEARKGLTGMDELVITGTLEYQACDDTLCYNPVSVPLSRTVALEGLVPGAPRPAQR